MLILFIIIYNLVSLNFGFKESIKSQNFTIEDLKKSKIIYAFDSAFKKQDTLLQFYERDKKTMRDRTGFFRTIIKYSLLKKDKSNDGKLNINIIIQNIGGEDEEVGSYNVILTWKYNQQTGELYDFVISPIINKATKGYLKVVYSCHLNNNITSMNTIIGRHSFFFQYKYNFNDDRSLYKLNDKKFTFELYKSDKKGFYFDNSFDISFSKDLKFYSLKKL